ILPRSQAALRGARDRARRRSRRGVFYVYPNSQRNSDLKIPSSSRFGLAVGGGLGARGVVGFFGVSGSTRGTVLLNTKADGSAPKTSRSEPTLADNHCPASHASHVALVFASLRFTLRWVRRASSNSVNTSW